ncbi:MAG: hypothetical protein NT154_38215 [Verrucomicrobia bacterium]|nr:hypothetical protein [Verrucomicrobiota bacterium]
MADKIKMLKLLQEIRGFAEIANRCPPPRLPELLLSPTRSRVVPTVLPKRTLNVTTDEQHCPNIPHPVKIKHVRQNPASVAPLPCP